MALFPLHIILCGRTDLSRDMTKRTKWLCVQRRLRSAWESAQSDQSLPARLKKAWVHSYPLSAQRRLIRLGGCPGWSESSLGAQSFCWFCHVAAHISFFSFSVMELLFYQWSSAHGFSLVLLCRMKNLKYIIRGLPGTCMFTVHFSW